MRSSLLALFVATGLHAQMPYGYEWMNTAPSPQIVERSAAPQGGSSSGQGQPQWRWSVGYAVRNFEADFKTPAPGLGSIASYLGGIGDIGFYRDGSDILRYEDGYVGPGYGDGTAAGRVISDWATPGHPADPNFDTFGPIFAVGPGVDYRGTKTCHTKMFHGPDRETHASGDGAGFGPYVSMSLTLAESESSSLGLSVTWTGLRGQMDAASHLGHPQRTDFIYTYDDVYFEALSGGPGPNYWIGASGLVIDASAVNALYEEVFGTPGTFRNPRKSTQDYTITDWTATGYSSLDVRLNELFLSVDAVWKPRRGWELGLSAGPTLNVVGTTLNSRTTWVRNDGLAVPGMTTRQNDTHVAVGAGVQGVARYDLTKDGRAFIEARAGYKWLNDIAIKGPGASADLDLSDWEVGLGVGVRLNDWPAGSPWSVRAGVDTRMLSFKAGAADKAAMRSIFPRSSGRGDVGFFNGRDTIQYDDGYIIGRGSAGLPVVGFGTGGYNTFSINHASQADLEYDPALLLTDTHGHIHFHSTRTQSELRNVSASGRQDAETALSPYVEWHRDFGGWGPVSAGLTWGWSGWSDHYSQERALSATVTALQTVTTYQYSYPYLRYFDTGPLSATRFPYSDDSLIADPRYFDFGWPVTRSKRGTTRTSLVRYYAFTSASVDVSMQTLSFAGDLAWKPLKHLELAFSAGPTVNVVSTSTDLSTDWVREDGLLFARLQDHDEKTQLCLGFRLMASARYDLTRDGRWYAEARGGYEWMQDIDVGIGLQAASIEATSWQVGGGIGCRLGVRPRLEAIRHLKPDKPKAVLPTTAAPPRGPLTARKAQ